MMWLVVWDEINLLENSGAVTNSYKFNSMWRRVDPFLNGRQIGSSEPLNSSQVCKCWWVLGLIGTFQQQSVKTKNQDNTLLSFYASVTNSWDIKCGPASGLDPTHCEAIGLCRHRCESSLPFLWSVGVKRQRFYFEFQLRSITRVPLSKVLNPKCSWQFTDFKVCIFLFCFFLSRGVNTSLD